jgi:hypothetical protein
VLSFAAVHPKTTEGLPARVVDLHHGLLREQGTTLDWRYALVRLLVASDRTEELVALLRGWIEPAKVDSQWRIALGYLLAEGGKLRDAVAVFDEAQRFDGLGPAEYQVLSDWLLALGANDRRAQARRARYAAMSENELYQFFNSELDKVSGRRGQVPEAVDPEVFVAAEVLLQKAVQPVNYVWRLRNFYRQTKDFRALGCLAHGALGHSQQQVYDWLRRADDLIDEVHEEATCDTLREELATRIVGVCVGVAVMGGEGNGVRVAGGTAVSVSMDSGV